MKFNKDIPVFGDSSFRGDCPKEDTDQVNFVAWLRYNYPERAKMMVHVKTEGKRTWGQINYEKKMGGIPSGFSDLFIIGNPNFCVELKRKDHTKSKWQKGQESFLLNSKEAGCFIGVALGFEGAKEAFIKWLDINQD